MADSNNPIHESGVSVKSEEQESGNGGTVGGETPRTDGGTQSIENPKAANEKKEQNAEKKSRFHEEVKPVLMFATASVAAGYISFLLTPAKPAAIPATSLLIVLATMIAVFLGTKALIQKLLGKKDMQWIMGNGGAIYLFLWFVTWIIFYNAL